MSGRARDDIDAARARVRRKGKRASEGQTISELSFGFWRFLITKKLTGLWPDLASAFPHAPDRKRETIEEPIARLHDFRNRLAHHQRIWNRNPLERYRDLLVVSGYLDPDLPIWIDATCVVPSLLSRSPRILYNDVPTKALAFRNVEVSPVDPVSTWPIEAIQTALERGGLSDWRRLAVAVDNEPWGPVARQIEEVLGYSRPYGIAEAMERVIARARVKAERSERDQVAQEVNRLIEKSGLTGTEFASRIDTSTSRLSTYATGRVTPSAALLLRMLRVAGLASLAGTWSGRVQIAEDFDQMPNDLAESLGMRSEHS